MQRGTGGRAVLTAKTIQGAFARKSLCDYSFKLNSSSSKSKARQHIMIFLKSALEKLRIFIFEVLLKKNGFPRFNFINSGSHAKKKSSLLLYR
jgi:hypothetical protein